MKKIVFIVLFATLFVACDKDGHEDNLITPPNLTQIIQEEPFFNENKIFSVNKSGAKITYLCRIGNDFDSALDSLIRERESLLTGQPSYSGQGYNIDKKKINVDFSYDSREFILLTFIDKANIYNLLCTGDVIDEKGNYFVIIWPED